ncbi:hypothetical protein ACKWTF_005639 [Chironomus riparius]
MKSNKVAQNYSEKASELLAVGKNSDALKNCNNCLRFATAESAESLKAMAAREKVYTKFGSLKASVDNLCSSVDSLEDLKEDFFKLSHPPNPKIPFIADCLEVKENDVYGRFIATKKDLLPGDVVIMEEPFYKIISPSEKNSRCSVCLKQNSLNLISCEKCSAGKEQKLFHHQIADLEKY